MKIVEPRPSAALILTGPEGTVLIGQRQQSLPFLGGFLSFPGGGFSEADHQLARALYGENIDPLDTFRVTALRELFEETGLILSQKGLYLPPDSLRNSELATIYGQMQLTAPSRELSPAGRWVTPEYAKMRFETHFFHMQVQNRPETTPEPKEFDWCHFVSLEEIQQKYLKLDTLIPRPTRMQLQVLREHISPHAEKLAELPGGDGQPVYEFEPLSGIRQLPLRTPTLPPATHTNAYVIGHEQLIVVDPATFDDDERQKLKNLLDSLLAQGASLKAVVLTHHHHDHYGAAMWLKEVYGVEIWAHQGTQNLLADKVEFSQGLDEGDTIDLGKDSSGEPFLLKVWFTPGHAPGHISLLDQRFGGKAMIVGDMVAAIGTIIIDPPEGNMAEYIRQLRRLRDLPEQTMFAAHGPPIVSSHYKLDQYITHRLGREAKVLTALRESADESEPYDLLSTAYADTPEILYPLAARACLAHLEKLVEDGLAREAKGKFSAL